jgi:hypothetical protein
MDPAFDARLEQLMRAAAQKQFVPSPDVRAAFFRLQNDVNAHVPFGTFNASSFKNQQTKKQ